MNWRDLAGDAPLVWRAGASVSRRELLLAAATVARRMPPRRFAVNLCESRESFLVTFAASILARQMQLMPSARTPGAIAELDARYPDNHYITDEVVSAWCADREPDAAPPAGDIDEDLAVMAAFTSGSTGDSLPHEKSFRALLASSRLNSAAVRAAAGLAADAHASIVGTVPAHHMYGVELTVLMPLFAGMSVHAGRPLFPADVAAALANSAPPRILVSTPLHLRALADAQLSFPAMDLVVSATAPLDQALATRIEGRLGAPLLEMFGSTETCVFASRRTAFQQNWELYDGVGIEPGEDSTRVSAGWFLRDQVLQDVLELRGPRQFALRGRHSDMVEVAGKRASLSDIARRICAVPGVEDAVAFQTEAAAGTVSRVAALVVGKGVTERQVVTALAASLDAVFLPRPLLLVEKIPRDAVGKISRARLLALANYRSE
jgi:acyl-coenzyme A synthetase/AMP-(fatty) acid ligase